MNFYKKFFLEKMLKKISIITCPTELTKDYLISKNIIIDKIFVPQDPIISLKEVKNKFEKLSKNTKTIFLQLVG